MQLVSADRTRNREGTEMAEKNERKKKRKSGGTAKPGSLFSSLFVSFGDLKHAVGVRGSDPQS